MIQLLSGAIVLLQATSRTAAEDTLLSKPFDEKIDYILVKNLEFNNSGLIFNDKNITRNNDNQKS